MRPAVLAALLLLLAPLAHASGVLAQRDAEGTGWWAARFTPGGAPVVATMEISRPSTPFMAAYLLFDANGEALGGFHFTNTPRGDGAHVEVAPVGLRVDTYTETSQASFTLRVEMPDHVATETIVLWLSGEAERIAWRIEGEAPARVDATSFGARTTFALSRHFEGGANVVVQQDFQGARAQALTHRSVEAEGTLLGFFHPTGPAQAGQLSAATPDGELACDCYFLSAPPSAAARGPGAYDFRLTGAGAGSPPVDEVVLGLADVQLPG